MLKAGVAILKIKKWNKDLNMSDAFRLEGGCSLKDLGRSKDGNQKDSEETVSGSLRALEDIYREDFKEKMIPKPRRKGPLLHNS